MTKEHKIKPPPACTLVIFGATGDLTRRLLMPALRNMHRDGLLPSDFALLGVASRDIGDDGFRDHLRKGMEEFKGGTGGSDIDWFLERTRYVSGKFEQGRTPTGPSPSGWARIATRCSISPRRRRSSRSSPSSSARRSSWTESDGALAAADHREAVRPRPAVGDRAQQGDPEGRARGADLPHRPLSRQGDGAEHHGVPLRQRLRSSRCGAATTSTTCRSPSPRRSASSSAASRTTRTGALRDMMPNHLFQLLSLIAMEPPGYLGRPMRCATRRPRCSTPCTISAAEDAASQRGARPVRRGQGRRQAGRWPIARRPTCRPIRPPRPSSR